MGKIKIDDIRKAAIEHDWKVISETYKNLDTEMTFECDEGHKVYLPYKQIRDKWECPLCKKNQYHQFDTKIIKKDNNKQRVIALDQATHMTGYSIFDNNELIYSDVFEAKEDNEIDRDIEIRNWLIQMIQKWQPDIIGLEDIQLQQFDNKLVGVTTYRTLARLQGILLAACRENNVDCVVCSPSTWRAHCKVKGRTRADKKKSMQTLVKQWFDISVTDDIADAIGIGKYISDTYKKKVEIFNWE